MSQHAGLAPDLLRIPALAVGAGPVPRRHVLSILDLSPEEVLYLCRRALRIKQAPVAPQTLRGRTVGVYFRKTSTRTRTGFMVGAGRLGATTVYFGPADLQTNTGETLEDTARTFAGYLDVLVMRTNEGVDEMRTFASHPAMSVVNALSSDEHPTQGLTDLTTMLEHFGRLEGLDVLYCGEGNKSAAALALALSRIPGTRFTVATPEGYGLRADKLAAAQALAAPLRRHPRAGARRRRRAARRGRGLHQPLAGDGGGEARRRLARALCPVPRVAGADGARSAQGTVFMHDLPAVRGEDVDDAVLDGPQSLAWVQAQHKMFSAMSVMEWCGAGVQDEG